MKSPNHQKVVILFAVSLGLMVTPISHVRAASAAAMNQKANSALHDLYARSAAARNVGHHAKAVLVFPEILSAGNMATGHCFLTVERLATTKLWRHRTGSKLGHRNSATPCSL